MAGDYTLKLASGSWRWSVLALAGGFALSACTSTPELEPAPAPVVVLEPEPEPVVELYEPAPVPSIDISEWENRQKDSVAIAERLERLRLEREAEAPTPAVAPTPAPAPTPVVVARAEVTLDDRLAAAADPDARIAILRDAPQNDDTKAKLREAYEAKLAADREAGDMTGAAQALVWLGEADNGSRNRETRLLALRRFAEAQELDPGNAEAPGLVSRMRAQLQDYADDLHAQAVELFVKQDFGPAVSRWETVLLIDPGNTAARNWFAQASEALGR